MQHPSPNPAVLHSSTQVSSNGPQFHSLPGYRITWICQTENYTAEKGKTSRWHGWSPMPSSVQNQRSQVLWETINSLILLPQLKPCVASQWQNHKVSVVVCSVTEQLHVRLRLPHKTGRRVRKEIKMHLRSYLCLMLKSLNAQTIIYHYRSTGGQYNALELCTMTQFSIKIFLQCRVLRNC